MNVTVNLDKEFREKLLETAKASGMTLGAYVRFILEQNVGRKVERRLASVGDEVAAAAIKPATTKAKGASGR